MNRHAFLRLGAIAVLATALLTAACNRDKTSAGSGGDSAAQPLIGVDYPRSDTDFWNSYIKYVPEFAKELGVELKTTNSQNDIANLISNVQTFRSQGVKGVVMAPQDTAAVAPTLDQLASAKIPVVTIDTRPDTGKVFMVVRADNRAYGTKACQFLGTKLGGKGKVVMLQGGLDSINGRDRTEAFNECMKKDFPGVTVFGEATDWKADVAASKLQTRFTSDPDIKGVYMQSSFALSGTLQILAQRGLKVPPTDPKHALTEQEALALLRDRAAGRDARAAELLRDGYPAYTTTPGWLGYDDDKLDRLCAEAVGAGYQLIKLKVGGNLADDVRRMGIARRAVGPDIRIAVDANQIWGVPDAIGWMRELSRFDPYWIEEPTSPDDVQIDACRVGGVNENLAILLLAAKFGVPVCPHAGGVGLCELVQHLAMFDYVAVSGSLQDRFIEYVDHLHEHFAEPAQIRAGRYLAPTAAGMSAEITPASLHAYRFPDGPAWTTEVAA
ncbi:substrate-binding domain-containing protein [Actinoplanes xinjiangensis]|uniref:Enolase-like protein n=1 Tax=Actinoplanes xinjiangensis TaxID=512350 RepID=A0A316ETV0_9ACTN|nr:substrate-binding domain-containing protein [Actinoplanes xinjiangensis]PWK36074.1 enolase-like protein [Actinoplanes xinjiangensis]GIF42923.1 hypothetical protein Axi01nite_72340 [Actinoplanes xinjiangensis]